MQFDATGASLTDLFRSLNVDPAEKEALVRLAEKVSRLEHEAEYQQMLFGEDPAPVQPPLTPEPRKPKTPPEKRWLHAVPRLGLVAGMAAAVRHHRAASRVLASAALVTVGTAGALTPDMMQPAPAAQVPVVHPHPVAHHRHHGGDDVTVPPGLPARRKRRRLDNDKTATPRASASPSPSVSPGPTPAVTPDPEPSVTVPPPVPTPGPTCTVLHGKHCHGGEVGDVVSVPGALRGLMRLS